MKFDKKIIPKCVVFIYIITQIFALALSFVDEIYGADTWQQNIIDNIYLIRNISFIFTMAIVVLLWKITIDDVILVLFIGLSYLIMKIFFVGNIDYFNEVQPILKYSIGVFVAVRTNYLKFDELKKILLVATRGVMIIQIIIILQNIEFLIANSMYMDLANAISIGVALLLYSGIMDWKVYDLVIASIGIILLFLYGSRGALLTLGILIVYLLWIKYKQKKIVIYGMIIGLILIILGPTLLANLLRYLTNLGIDSRSIEKLMSGKFFTSNDRMRIYQYLINALGKNWIWGVGLCGDRYLLPKRFSGVDATYAHNLILEILLDYGIIIGACCLAIIGYLIYKCFFKENDINRKGFFAAFFAVSILQLMISRSWLTEQNLFVFFALLLTFSTSSRMHLVVTKRKFQFKGKY